MRYELFLFTWNAWIYCESSVTVHADGKTDQGLTQLLPPFTNYETIKKSYQSKNSVIQNLKNALKRFRLNCIFHVKCWCTPTAYRILEIQNIL